jgi:PPOX class probable FMN-dependent enzyme
MGNDLATSEDPHRVDTLDQVYELVGEPIPGIEVKVDDRLDEETTAFIERAPFLVLATADADGNVDTSPKGDEPGFVLVEDDQTLVIPDRPGNRLVFGLKNILSNPHVGVLFMVPGTNETFRVNGRAELTSDPVLLDELAARGKPALLGIRVHIDECFHHCAKAFIRSKLWKHETWPEKRQVSFGRRFADKLGVRGDDGDKLARDIDTAVEEDYRTNL